jgi:hypothetical protein
MEMLLINQTTGCDIFVSDVLSWLTYIANKPPYGGVIAR